MFRQAKSQRSILIFFNIISAAVLFVFALSIFQHLNDQKILTSDILSVPEDGAQGDLYIMTVVALTVAALILANIIIILLLSKGARTVRHLEDIEETYRQVLDSTGDGLFDYNPRTNKIVFSRAYKSQLGYKENELPDDMELGFNLLVHPDDRMKVKEQMALFMNRKIPQFTATYRLHHYDGSWKWVLSRALGIWDKDGHCTRVIGIHADITKEKQQEEALRELNSELESFTYIASHDLRSPLVNMKGFTKEIEASIAVIKEHCSKSCETLPGPEAKKVQTAYTDIQESISFINSAVERMENLTGAILNLSRIGRRSYRPTVVNMNEMVKRCTDSLNYEITNHRAKVNVGGLPALYADSVAIEQIFSNLIDNAVKYLTKERDGEININCRELQSDYLFSIEDNGRGISPEDADKVFDIFRRARNAIDVHGSGMGLAGVRTALRKMGGKIWYESALNKGTTFYITIPKTEEAIHA